MKKKKRIWPYFLGVIGLLLILNNSCTKEDIIQLPEINRVPISNITDTSATSGGNIAYNGSYPILSRGVCWSLRPSPTILDNKTIDGSGSGSFISTLSGLSPDTYYYVRSYAINSIGMIYSNEETLFKTLP